MEKPMKRLIAAIITVAVLLSIAVPISAFASVGKVTNVEQISAGTESIEIQWSTLLGNGIRYHVELSQDKQNWVDYGQNYGWTTGKDKSISNLVPGTTYYARVKATDDSGKTFGPASDAIEVTTRPDDVKNLVQTDATTSSITLKWDKSAGATGYRVCEWVNDQEYVVGSTTKTSYTIKKLSNKTAFPYRIYVRPYRTVANYTAEAAAKYSWTYSSIYNSDIKLVPKKSSAPKVSNYYWYINDMSFDNPSVAFKDGYEIKVYKANSKKVYSSLTNTTSFNTIKKNQFYKVKRRYYSTIGAKKDNKYGAWSKFSYISFGCEKINASAGKNSLSVSWSKVKGGKVVYDIYVSKAENTGLKKFKKNVKGTSIKVTKYGKKKLSRRTKYYVYVVPKLKVGKKYYASTVQRWVSMSTT